ncbi:hypothetical protein FQZ41_20315 [Escherichia coli]|nr:hypothetical protein [Escherichia coli]
MLPSETMIWKPEFTDKTLSRKPGAVHRRLNMFTEEQKIQATTTLTLGGLGDHLPENTRCRHNSRITMGIDGSLYNTQRRYTRSAVSKITEAFLFFMFTAPTTVACVIIRFF